MKKFLKIFGIIFLITAIVLCALAYWQRNNLKALINGIKYTDDELDNMVITAQEDLKKSIEEFSGTPLREYTEEEKQRIESGEVTADEVMAQIINEALEEKISSANSVPNNEADNSNADNNASATTQAGNKKSADTIINEHVSRLYSLKSSYIGRIDALMAEGASEYYAAVKNQSPSSARANLLPKYMSRLSALESACDSEVEAIISSLTAELKALNHNLDIIKTIRSAYANEKSLKMAQLISKYK